MQWEDVFTAPKVSIRTADAADRLWQKSDGEASWQPALFSLLIGRQHKRAGTILVCGLCCGYSGCGWVDRLVESEPRSAVDNCQSAGNTHWTHWLIDSLTRFCHAGCFMFSGRQKRLKFLIWQYWHQILVHIFHHCVACCRWQTNRANKRSENHWYR